MAGKVEERRETMRQRLIAAAERRIAEQGMGALKARDLAAEAGCALGAIYTFFDDLNALVLEVNARTFRRLGEAATAALRGGTEGVAPVARMLRLAHAYLAFAEENTNLWRALFAVDMASDSAIPDWYQAELDALFAHIAGPVAELFPGMTGAERHAMTRALFAAVHGIVLIGLQNTPPGAPTGHIRDMMALILTRLRGDAG